MVKRSRVEYSLINIASSMGGYSLNILLSFICRIVFTRQLSETYLGVNGLFTSILSVLSLSELGIGTAMLYALYKPIAEGDNKKIASYMKLFGNAYRIIGIIIMILGMAIMPVLDFIIKDPPNISENLYVLYFLFLLSTASSYFFSYRSSLLIAYQRNYLVVGISYATVIIQNLLQIISLLWLHNYLVYLILQIVFVFIGNVLVSAKAIHDYPFIKDKTTEKLTKQEVFDLIRNIKALTVTKLSGILVNNTDNIVITYFNGLITTGFLSNYSLLVSTLTALLNQIFSAITASVGNLNAEKDGEHKYNIFLSLNLLNFWLYGWASIGIVCVSGDIVKFCFGEKYVMPEYISILLAINFFMLGMQMVVGIYKSTMGLFRYGQYMLLLTAIINLLGDFILGKKWGIAGILAATIISRVVTNTWYEPYAVYRYGFKKDFGVYVLRYLMYVTLLIGTTIVCYCLCNLVAMPLGYMLGIKLLICVIVPNIVFILLFCHRKEFLFVIGIWDRLKRKFN